MFYKHSNIGGRIQPADANAYNPAGMTAGEVKDSGFRFGDANTKAVSADGIGAIGAAVQEIPPRLLKTREMQALFLTETGVPVHLKRGARDVIAYRGTMGACGVGLVYFGYVMYRMAYGLK